MFATPDYGQAVLYGSVFPKAYCDSVVARSPHNSVVPDAAAADAPDGRHRITYDLVVPAQVKEAYIRGIAAVTNNEAARGLDDYCSRHGVRELFHVAIRPYGLRDDDLADVTAANLVVLRMMANGVSPPARARVRGVAQQVRRQMMNHNGVLPESRERQRVAEALMYQPVTLMRVRETASAPKATEYLATLADSAQDVMRRYGVDLRALAMTNAGLEPR